MADTRLNIKQILLTAVITCGFTVVAGVVTYFITTKQASLSYSVVSGPTLSIQGSHKRIFSVNITNSGRKEVLDGAMTMNFSQGRMEEVSYQASPGVALTEDKKPSAYSLTASLLNPEEHFSVSVLASIPSPDYSPVIAVRGRGVVGTSKEGSKSSQQEQLIFILVGSAAALAGLLTSVSPFFRRLLGRTSIPTLAGAFVASGQSVGPFDRNELVAYILGLCSLRSHSHQIRFAPSEISYRGAADYIVSEAIAAANEDQKKLTTALKSMLLIASINEDSVQVIASALKSLASINDESINTLRKRAINPDTQPVRLREAIAELIRAETATATVQQTVPADRLRAG